MSKETKYLGSLKKVKIHPVKKPLADLATIGLRLDNQQLKQLSVMLAKAIDQDAQSVVLTAHRCDSHLTILYA
jgi:hypothetical protein